MGHPANSSLLAIHLLAFFLIVAAPVGGLIFSAILLLTGSLWAGMAYHAAADLSVLVYWRPKPAGE